MATTHQFGNKVIQIPGGYSRVESGVQNPPVGLDSGSLVIIDTGSGANWGGGSGVNGALLKGKDTIYEFDNIQAFRQHVKGGLWYDLAFPLFRPSQLGIPGVSNVRIIRACTTTAGTIALTWTGGGSNGGTITFKAKNEGVVSNGSANSGNTNLEKGYACKMKAGVQDSAKFIVDFIRGTYKDNDSAGEPIGLTAAKSNEDVFASSEEFDNIQELYDWAITNVELVKLFEITVSVAGTGAVTAADLAATNGYQLMTGGTETYNAADLDSAIEAVEDLTVDFILCDRWGDDATDTENLEILAMAAGMDQKPDVYFGGGVDALKFTQTNGSIPLAISLNNEAAAVVHSGIKVPRKDGTGMKTLPAIYHAAYVLGRESGLEPQNSLTSKGIGVGGLAHSLNKREIKQCLDNGVIATVKEGNLFSIIKGVNSLQDNANLINEDGTTHSKQIRRIVRQLNKEIAINSKNDLLRSEEGVNRNNLTEGDVKNWLETYLLSVTGTLIISFQNVTVTRRGDAYYVEYMIEPNSEINFLFFVGLIINV